MNPSNRMDIQIADTPQTLARMGAELIVDTARRCVAKTERFTLALSGGSTPRPMHRLLAQPPYINDMPWAQTFLFWVDERMVPHTDPASNYGAARADLLDRVPLEAERVLPMPVQVTPQKAVQQYEQTLRRVFANPDAPYPVFDLILLGIGSDGHTASLFPADAPAASDTGWVRHVRGGDPHVDRLTLTYSVINSAATVAFVVAGSGKADMVRRIFSQPSGNLPAGQIKPQNGRLVWLLDQDASVLLPADAGRHIG